MDAASLSVIIPLALVALSAFVTTVLREFGTFKAAREAASESREARREVAATAAAAAVKVAEVHELVNDRATKQDAKIALLEAAIKEMSAIALAEAKSRDAHPPGPSA